MSSSRLVQVVLSKVDTDLDSLDLKTCSKEVNSNREPLVNRTHLVTFLSNSSSSLGAAKEAREVAQDSRNKQKGWTSR